MKEIDGDRKSTLLHLTCTFVQLFDGGADAHPLWFMAPTK